MTYLKEVFFTCCLNEASQGPETKLLVTYQTFVLVCLSGLQNLFHAIPNNQISPKTAPLKNYLRRSKVEGRGSGVGMSKTSVKDYYYNFFVMAFLMEMSSGTCQRS